MTTHSYTSVEHVHVDSDAAGISITATDGAETSVTLEDRRGEACDEFLDVAQDGSDLRVRVRTMREGRWRRTTNVDVRLRIVTPRDVAVTVEADAGAIRVEDRTADVVLHAKAGAVKVSDVRGRVEARTEAGAISLANTSGDAKLSSHAGAIKVVAHDGDTLELRTSVGGVKGSDLDVRTLRATSEVGASKLTFATVPDDVDVRSSVGAVSIVLPQAEYEIDQQTGSFGRTKLEGLVSTPGAAHRVRVVSSGIGASKIAAADATVPA
jgi:DUF4097 and DUF4098 domain-containing protein YvlB